MLLVDFEKVFDSMSWDFLFKVLLDFFTFRGYFMKWVQLFYTKYQSCVIVNGHLSLCFYYKEVVGRAILCRHIFMLFVLKSWLPSYGIMMSLKV